MRKGTRVASTGKGKTEGWGTYKGTVTRRTGDRVFVHWDRTHFEDEMTTEEVKITKS